MFRGKEMRYEKKKDLAKMGLVHFRQDDFKTIYSLEEVRRKRDFDVYKKERKHFDRLEKLKKMDEGLKPFGFQLQYM